MAAVFAPLPGPRVVASADAAAALFAPIARGRNELAVVAYLDPQWRLLGWDVFEGSCNRVTPPLRVIVATALRLDAAALILAHNHPGGEARPSAADLAFTRTLVRLAGALDIAVADHLILACEAVTSLRAAGMM